MDYLLNTYVFQYLPFHVSDPTRKYVIDKAVSVVQVRISGRQLLNNNYLDSRLVLQNTGSEETLR